MSFLLPSFPNKDLSSIKNKALLYLKIVVSASSLLILYTIVREELSQPLEIVPLSSKQLVLLSFTLLLMPFNILLEVLKWRNVLSHFLPVDVGTASRQIMRGMMLNWLIPFTIGDMLAKIENTDKLKEKTKAIFISRVSSLGITLLFGLVGLAVYFHRQEPVVLTVFLSGMVVASVIILLASILLRNFRALISLGLARFFVFSLQFYCLLVIFLPELPLFIMLSGVFWVFLIKSVVPSVGGALGLRELSTVTFFSLFVENPTALVMPGLLLWIINLVIPSALSAFFFSGQAVSHNFKR